MGINLLDLLSKKYYSSKHILYLYLSLFIAALGSLQTFLILTALLAVIFLPYIIINLKNRRKETFKLFIHFLLGLFCFGVIFYFIFKDLFQFAPVISSLRSFHPLLKLAAYILPNPHSPTVLGNFLSRFSVIHQYPSADASVYLGWIELLFFVLFLFKRKKNGYEKIIIGLCLLFWYLSLGPNVGFPNIVLYSIYPLKGVFESYRIFVLYYLFFCWGSILGIFFFLSKILNAKYIVVGLLFIFLSIILERVTIGYYRSPTLQFDYLKIIKPLKGEGVLFIPLQGGMSAQNNLFMIHTGKKIIDGYIYSFTPIMKLNTYFNENGVLTKLFCDIRDINYQYGLADYQNSNQDVNDVNMLLNKLYKYNVTHIVINTNIINLPECTEAKKAASVMFENNSKLKLIYRDSFSQIYEISNI